MKALSNAASWAADHKRVALPIAFAVLLATNLGLLLAFGPGGEVRGSQAIDLSGVTQDGVLPGVDEDSDGVSDLDERLSCGTSERKADTDGDGLPDAWECRWRAYDAVSGTYAPDPLRSDADADPDRDGLTNIAEYRAGLRFPCLNPRLWDSDGDGIGDGYEVTSGLNPCEANSPDDDSDGDGLTDFLEARLGTNATSPDSDRDGVGDKQEHEGTVLPNGTRVKSDPAKFSTGGTGISDGWLLHFGLDPRDPSVAFRDPDLDLLPTVEEFNWSDSRLQFRLEPLRFRDGLDPLKPDTDNDGMPDGWEILYGLDPLNPADAAGDEDKDGLSNLDEYRYRSNPNLRDSDHDGLDDFTEVTGRLNGVTPVRCIGDRPGEERATPTCDERRLRPWRSDPLKADSDRDGLADGLEWAGQSGGKPFCESGPCVLDPMSPDSDLDGLTDLEEIAFELKGKRLSPLAEDTDLDGLKDGAEYEMWNATARAATDAQLAAIAEKRGKGESIDRVREELLPEGDIDDDGIANIVDADADGDTISDGEEVAPPRRPDRDGVPHPWPATHAGLFDTDGDGLDDGWEKRFVSWDSECDLWNLNPAKRNSYDGPCRPKGMSEAEKAFDDGARDLDRDGVHYTAGYAQPIEFRFTNLLEYVARTDPNDRDTDGDGVDDGWEVYFGSRGVPLDPKNGQDVNATARTPGGVLKVYDYRRYAKAQDPALLTARPGETRDPSVCPANCFPVGTDSSHVAVFRGTWSRTYLDEFRDLTSPLTDDTDGDGLPDAYESYWRAQASSGQQSLFSPVNGDGARTDADGDSLTTLEEYNSISRGRPVGRHLNPLTNDTDFGGLADGVEINGDRSDPLDPLDDDPLGDPDHDGLANVHELRLGLLINDFDTDRDGLLDGPDSPLWEIASSPWVPDMLSRGVIVLQRTATHIQFAGESDRSLNPAKTDTDGDGMPDGYEVFYNLDPTLAEDGRADHDADGLFTVDEYRMGRPASWNATVDGIWWFGSNPRAADSDGDGENDGFLDDKTWEARGDRDYDNDGLDDFNGEDPFPFYDHANTGLVNPRNAETARAWLATARAATVGTDVDNDSIPDRIDRGVARIEVDRVRSPEDDVTVYKGGKAIIEGRVTTLLANGTRVGVPGVLVGANFGDLTLRRGAAASDPSLVLGLALTGSDGRFRLVAEVARDRSVTLGPALRADGSSVTQAVVFGQVRDLTKPITWTLDTSVLAPRSGYSWVVFSYGIGVHENRYSNVVTCGGCASSFSAEGLSGTFARTPATEGPWVDGLRRFVKTNTTLAFDKARLSAQNEGSFTTTGRLLDATGDPIVGGTVRLAWAGATREVVTGPGGAFSALFATGRFTEPSVARLTAEFRPTQDQVLSGASAGQDVVIAFPTSIQGKVLTPGLSAFAGDPVDVEVTLRDSFGKPVSGATVTARLVEADASASNTTDANGRARVRIVVAGDAAAGSQSVTVAFGGTDAYLASSEALSEFVSIRQRTILRVVSGERPLGKDLAIEGNVTDIAGRAPREPDATSRLFIGLETPGFASVADLTPDGRFRVLIPSEVISATGVRSVRVNFPGSVFYSASTATATFDITSATSLELSPGRHVRGGMATVTGTLVDDLGRGIRGAKVNASIGDARGSGETNATGGFAVLVPLPADFPTGPTVVRATFDGTSHLRPAVPVSQPSTVVAATRITIPEKTLPAGTLRLNATIRDDLGRPVGGAAVRIALPGTGLSATGISDARGEAQVTLDASRIPARLYTVTAAYEGSPLYGGSSATGSVTLLARTVLTTGPIEVAVRGTDLRLTGRLAEENGNGVGRATIGVSLNGTRLPSFLTGANGDFTALVGIPAGFPTGLHPLKLVFEGSPSHLGTERTVPIEVASSTSIEVLIPGSLRVGESFTGRILLKDDTGKPIPDAIVRVRFSGYFHPFTLKTNESGIASFPGRITASGSSELSVQFPGEEDLLATQKSRFIAVEEEGLLPAGGRALAVALVATLAILATASLALARFRRRQIRAAQLILGDAEGALLAGNEYVATILRAYKKLTDHFVRFGYVERADITPQEFAAAARTALPVREEPLLALIRLFEEARYSDHAIGPAQRDAALAALAAVSRDLASAGKAGPAARKPAPQEAA